MWPSPFATQDHIADPKQVIGNGSTYAVHQRFKGYSGEARHAQAMHKRAWLPVAPEEKRRVRYAPSAAAHEL